MYAVRHFGVELFSTTPDLRKIERFLSAAKPSEADGSLEVINKQRVARKHATVPKFRTRRAVPVGTGSRALD